MNTRAQRRITVALASLLALTSVAADASASRHYYSRVEARPIYRRDVLVSGTTQFGFQKYVIVTTANLRATPNPLDIGLAPVDTAMVVKNLQTGQSYFNDDCWGTSKSSCVFVPVSSSQNHLQVTVFAASALHFGVADISVNGAIIDEDVEFGGTIINLDLPNRRRPYRFQTVHVPNGADDTQLFLFDANWRERVHDDDSGVGRAAAFTAVKHTGDRLLVGSWAAASRGYASVVINDCVFHPDSTGDDRWECNRAGLDDDKDNLSNDLERELRTDPQHHDTDRDGLFDYYEVIGRIVGSSEQELAFYGASPRRRDLFLEYDQECRGTVWENNNGTPSTGTPLRGKCLSSQSLKANAIGIARVQEVFFDLPTMTPNPDGTTGIFIHADTGQSCAGASTVVCEGADCATLCGDWGGFDELALDDDVISSWSSAWDGAQYWHATTSRDRGWRTAMAPARRGLFYYVWLYRGNGHVSGQSKGQVSNSLRVPYGNDSSVTAHELGHCLGLSHSGNQPGTLINNSTAYPSTMNYTYQGSLYGVVDRPRFSRGQMARIDHTSLDETSYSPDVPDADRAYLAAVPLRYDLTLGSTGDAVDFNYDGRLNSPSGLPVEYDTAPMTAYGGLGWPDLYQNQQVGNAVPTGGGALAVEPVTADERIATVWAFAPFQHNDGVYPDYTSFRNDVLAEAHSSNLTHFDNWVPGVPMNGHPDGEVAAVSFEFSFGRRMLLLFPDANGVLNYRLVDSQNPHASSWAPIPGWVASSRARQASVTVVKGGPGSSDDRIDIVFKDISVGDFIPHVYLTSIDVNGNWDSQPQLQLLGDGTGVLSYFTPGITEGPDGYVYMAALHVASSSIVTARDLYFLRRPNGDLQGSWERVDALGVSIPTGLDPSSMTLRRRLNLVFLPYLEQGHQPFPDGSGYLAVFYNSGYPGSAHRDYWFHNRIYTTGFISPTQTQYGAPLGRRRTVAIDRPFPDHSTAVARRWNDAVTMHTAIAFWTGEAKPAVYQPFASGTPPVTYETAADFVDPFGRTVSIGVNADTDDAAIMSHSMCRSLRFQYGQCNCDPAKVDSSCEFDPVETPPDFPELVE